MNSIGFNASWDVAENFNLQARLPRFARAAVIRTTRITGGGETAFSLAGKVPSTGVRLRARRPDWVARTSGPRRSSSTTACRSRRARCSRPARRLTPTPAATRTTTSTRSSLGSQILRINYQEQNTEIKQTRFDGKFKFEDGSIVGLRRGDSRHADRMQLSSGSNLTMGDWGVGDTGTVPDMVALADAVQPHGCVQRLQPGWCSDRRLEGQCGRPRPVGHRTMATPTGRKLLLRMVS